MNAALRNAAGLLLVAGIVSATGMTQAGDLAKLEAQALAQAIDQAIGQRLKSEQVKPAPQADDAEFLRRACLDITGVIPSADRVAAFLDSKEPNKRAKLIDELLADPQYGRHMSDVWVLLMYPHDSNNRRLQPDPLNKWLEKEFNDNTPWNKLVTNLVTASGAQDQNGAVTYLLANPTVDKMTDSTTRLFLGVQLQCAQCHNHPFTGWKQSEYWAMAAFFMKTRPENPQKAAKTGGSPGLSETTSDKGRGKNQLPESAKIVPAKFLQGDKPTLDPKEPYRPVLANWMTSAENPFFARAMVNRMWAKFFGRGFVNPIDDMHEGNLASHPELLKQLSDQFVASGFDVKHLVRSMCNSQAYQRTSKPTAGTEANEALFSRMAIKALTPEQLYDSLGRVMGESKGDGNRKDNKGRVQAGPRAAFAAFFRTDDGADPTEYSGGIPQALRLMNSNQLNKASGLVDQASKLTPDKGIERLYLGTLSRRPTTEETQKMTAYLAKNSDSRKGYSDILWALLNSSEFALNH